MARPGLQVQRGCEMPILGVFLLCHHRRVRGICGKKCQASPQGDRALRVDEALRPERSGAEKELE